MFGRAGCRVPGPSSSVRGGGVQSRKIGLEWGTACPGSRKLGDVEFGLKPPNYIGEQRCG